MNRLTNKVAIVTGGASGIGLATSQMLAREGASLVVADINLKAAEIAASEINSTGGNAVAQAVDVDEEKSIVDLVRATTNSFGQVDILCNIAADTSSEMMALDTAIQDLTIEAWDRAIRTNLRGAVLACKHCIPVMLESGGGSIVSMSSDQGLSGDLTQSAYSCAKAAVVQLMRVVATQYGRFGIRANAVSPGATRTPAFERLCPPQVVDEVVRHNLIPRLGESDDVANAVLFLASDESAFITGQLLVVDGGLLAHLPTYASFIASGDASAG